MKAYFIGIGGIGVSALARKYLHEGWGVAGSDRAASRITEGLARLGAQIFYDPKPENISADTNLVIYTIAVPKNQPELARARELGLKVLSYPEALGELSRSHFTIAVAGTHGKTTTTAMLAKVAVEAGLDPTVIVGSLLAETGSNFIAGRSQYLIVEACEYRRSFLNLSPQILIITNIDNDHLDYYRDLDDIKAAFNELAQRSEKVITEDEYSKIRTDFKLKIPGVHNIRNAQAALAAAEALGIDYLTAVESLEHFPGTWRRFEFKGRMKNGAEVYDDYAHHPTEIRATLAGARELVKEGGKIFVIFQPHLYSRTKLLFNNFSESFTEADQVILTPIYAAREPVDREVSSEKLAKQIGDRAKFFPTFPAIAKYLAEKVGPKDLVITMGAGDISRLGELLL